MLEARGRSSHTVPFALLLSLLVRDDMPPLYEVIVMSKTGTGTTPELKTLLKSCASMLWDRGAVLADVRPWGQRELAYRIRKQGTNHYHAQYTSLHVYCSPTTLKDLEGSLKTSDHVLRWKSLKLEGTPKLDKATQYPNRKPPDLPSVDLEADPAEAARWEYRNLVMQRVFEGRTKQELIAEQLVRHRFQHAKQRAPPGMPRPGSPRLSDIRSVLTAQADADAAALPSSSSSSSSSTPTDEPPPSSTG